MGLRAAVLLAIALVWALAAPAAAGRLAEPGEGPLLPGAPAPTLRGTQAMRTYSVDMYRLPGALDAPAIQALGPLVEQAIISDTLELARGAPAHSAVGLAGRVAIRFEPPQRGACAIRGLTLSNERTIRLFYGPEADQQRVLGILAHELFHQLQRDYYGERAHRRADVILLEGMATWGTRGFFRDASGEAVYQRRVREALGRGELLPLTTSLERDCRTTTRTVIYDQWASFVEFLLTVHGRERFDALYRDSTGRAAGSANYRGVYGKSLEQLEADWRAWLRVQSLGAERSAGGLRR